MSDTSSSALPRQVADAYVDAIIELDPVTGTYLGVPESSRRLPDFSPAGQDAVADLVRATLRELDAAERRPGADSDAERRCGRLLRERLTAQLAVHEAEEGLRTVSNMQSPAHSITEVFTLTPTATDEDWAAVVERLRAVPAAHEGYRASLALGLERKLYGGPRATATFVGQLTEWGGEGEGDAFGRAARQFERLGVEALLVNCVPPDHVDGMVSYLRDFVDLPLGVYPNLGYPTGSGWRSATGVSGEEYADLALRWREEGAQIIGGCCGVGPDHITAASRRLTSVPVGRRRRAVGSEADVAPAPAIDPWRDGRGRSLYPLDFPELARHPGVFSPRGGSLLAWRHLFAERIGVGQRCLDVGTGTGLLAVQLARNGAVHVHAIDRDPDAVRNAEENAHRNGVGDRVSVAVEDLYRWRPEERYEVVVASLYQLPVDPFRAPPGHRPADYWGRNVLDELLDRLPEALASEGVAFVVQISYLSREATVTRLAEHGLRARVVGYELYPFPEEFAASADQIRRVEERSDGYHLRVGDQDLAVAYLLEIRWADDADEGPPWGGVS